VSATGGGITGQEFSNEMVVVMENLDCGGRVEPEKSGTTVDDVVHR
jgi:hypothetical protein